ncbi:hypothetical protein [Saliphagus sp. LR7]|uniref:DUF7555 family protein n=1 Tax=Saliphagus sp. LR7 TaxID=2282654 RepID=UPI000DF7429E|nr:hypothetical protein [Saliphagus sp. LR7]
MPTGADEWTRRLRAAVVVWVDAVGYAVVVAVVSVAAALAAAVVSGGGLVRGKALLFVVGFVLMGYATIRLWPTSPEDVERGVADSLPSPGERTRFQSLVRALPPLRWLPSPPPGSQLSPAGKLFLGSLLVLLASYLMETVFGVV